MPAPDSQADQPKKAFILEKAVVHESHEKHEPIQRDVTNQIITSMVSSMTQRNLDLFRVFRVFRRLIAVFRFIHEKHKKHENIQ